ncbi:HAD-like protein [Martensiomyces pterosporus]|nr:HAD-like protein [Martensiomyces pterosporus]
MAIADNTGKKHVLHAKALIFDLDGTLISTLDVTERVYTDCCRRYNIDPAPVLAHCHGVPTLEVLRKFYPPETHNAEFARQLEIESASLIDGLEVISGAPELISSIPEGKWGIFTSGLPLLAHPRMKHLKLPIPQVFVTPEDITNGKPHPEGYVKAARKLGFEPEECIVFEDAHAGTRAGHESGATVVGIRTLLSDAQLKDAGAHHTVKDMTRVSVSASEDGTLAITIDEE